jgi:hypothetical protein
MMTQLQIEYYKLKLCLLITAHYQLNYKVVPGFLYSLLPTCE